MNYKKIYDKIVNDSKILDLINVADKHLKNKGYVLHDASHSYFVCASINELSKKLLFTEREHYLSMISGYLHDIGNCISREFHEICGANIAFFLLKKYDLLDDDVSIVYNAIRNHRCSSELLVDKCSSLVYIADKTHIARARVRKDDCDIINDIHDKINYSITDSHIKVEGEKIIYEINIDEHICSKEDFVAFFSSKSKKCEEAAKALRKTWELRTNCS